MSPADVPVWFQAGGLLAFAAAVWWEQRSIRSTLERILEKLASQHHPPPRAPSNPVE